MQEQATSKNTSNKRIAQNTFYLYIRLFILLIVGLFTSRIILDQLGAVDYGLYSVVGSLVYIFTFVSGVLASSASRFMAVELEVGSTLSQNKVFCMTINIHLLFSIIIVFLAETIGLWYLFNKMVIPDDRFDAALIVYQLSCLNAIFSLLVIPYRALIIANERMQAFAYLSIIEVLARLAIAFGLYYEGFDKLILYGILSFFVQVGVNLSYFIYCKIKFNESKYHKVWDKLLFKEMIVFSGWTTFSYISGSVVNQGYNLIINLFCSPIVNAARAVAYTVQAKVLQFATNFQIALNPQIVKNYAANDVGRVEYLVEMSIKISFSLMFIMLFPILVNIKGILSIWLVEVPLGTELFVILICIAAIFSAMSNPLGVVAEAANKLKVYNLITIPIFVMALPVSYIALVIGLPAYSVFIVALLAEIIGMWVKFFYARAILEDKMQKANLLICKCMATIILFAGFGLTLEKFFNSSLISILICGTICFAASTFWVFILIMNRNERALIYNKIKTFIGYKN